MFGHKKSESGYQVLVETVPAVITPVIAVVGGGAKVAPASAPKPVQSQLDVAMKSLREHKKAENDFMNKAQLTRKVTTAVQHGAAFQAVDEVIKQFAVAKEIMANVANQLGGKFKADFEKANPPVIPDFLTPAPAAAGK